MALTKDDVRIWIGKCQSRALSSIMDKHEVELQELVDVNDELLDIFNTIETMRTDIAQLEKVLTDNNCESNSVPKYFHGFYSSIYSSYFDKQYQIIGNIVSRNQEKYPTEYAVVSEFIKRHNAVDLEYRTLKTKCSEMKPKQAVEYLQSIGFDTTTLLPADKPVDKSKLFVCGDNKPKEEN